MQAALILLALSAADYQIDATLDPERHELKASAEVSWTNTTTVPISELYWHLYLNAFRDKESTFMKESKGRLRRTTFVEGQYGHIEVQELSAGGRDLLAVSTFEHPDDDNERDRTVLRTPLEKPIGAGEKIVVNIRFTSKLPRVFARSGWAPPSFMMFGQWFPKLGVLNEEPGRAPAWNCHQYHGTGEFFADFATYRVVITAPREIEIGATGRRTATEEKEGGLVAHRYEQENVHDFAFAADSRFIRKTRKFQHAKEVTAAELAEAAQLLGVAPDSLKLPDVEVIMLLQPEHVRYDERYFRSVANAMKWYGLWYGPYPYETITLIDGPRTGWGAMGMEYPMLFTAGIRWPAPEEMPIAEMVTVHEYGHQYWYGLVASNEFEESWLDEGINTYSTNRVLDRAYGRFSYAPALLGIWLTPWFPDMRLSSVQLSWLIAAENPTSDVIVRPSWKYRDGASYLTNSYHRPALVLAQLEADVGASTMARIMRTYCSRWRFRHPHTQDFVDVAEEVSGRSLSHFWREFAMSTKAIDYAVAAIENDEKESSVLVERRGEAVHPIRVQIDFRNGRREVRDWDGEYRWTRYRFPGQARIASAQIVTPLLYDIDPNDNTRTGDVSSTPAFAFGAHAEYWVQTLLSLLGGLW
jgi:hypothetical protein